MRNRDIHLVDCSVASVAESKRSDDHRGMMEVSSQLAGPHRALNAHETSGSGLTQISGVHERIRAIPAAENVSNDPCCRQAVRGAVQLRARWWNLSAPCIDWADIGHKTKWPREQLTAISSVFRILQLVC